MYHSMDRLIDILRQTLQGYAGKGLNGMAYLTENRDATVFSVIDVAWMPENRFVDAGMIVRIVQDKIVIERDLNDKVLVDALLQAGIARDQIILAYAGEPVPDAA